MNFLINQELWILTNQKIQMSRKLYGDVISFLYLDLIKSNNSTDLETLNKSNNSNKLIFINIFPIKKEIKFILQLEIRFHTLYVYIADI